MIVVPMDDAAAPDFALRVFQKVGARLLVGSREYVASFDCPRLSSTISRRRCQRHSSASFPAETGPEDALQIVFTSGTTAEPKGVVITHGNVLANVTPLEHEITKYLKYERIVHPIRFLNLLPLSHVFGQFLGMFLPQLMGGTVIFQDTLKPAEVIGTIRRERVSVLVAVPRMLQSLKEKIERDLEDRKARWTNSVEDFRRRKGNISCAGGGYSARMHRQFGFKFWAFISGGAALDSDTEEFWGRLGFAVIQGYGLTETTSLISVNHPFRAGQGIDRESAGGARGQAERRWRDPGAWWRGGFRILGEQQVRHGGRRRRLVQHGRHRRTRCRKAIFISRDARKKSSSRRRG